MPRDAESHLKGQSTWNESHLAKFNDMNIFDREMWKGDRGKNKPANQFTKSASRIPRRAKFTGFTESLVTAPRHLKGHARFLSSHALSSIEEKTWKHGSSTGSTNGSKEI
jgi:hypothetical protein